MTTLTREQAETASAKLDELTEMERLLDTIDEATRDYDPTDALVEVLNSHGVSRVVGNGLIEVAAKDAVARIREGVERSCRETAAKIGFEWVRPAPDDDDDDGDECCDDGCVEAAA